MVGKPDTTRDDDLYPNMTTTTHHSERISQ